IAARGGLTARQISTLFYPPVFATDSETSEKYLDLNNAHSNCRDRLKRHLKEGNVRRIERYQLLSEGKKPYVYALTRKGARVLAEHLGCEIEDLDWRQTDVRLTKDNIEHLVQNNDFFVAVAKCAEETPSIELATWRDELFLKVAHSR